MGQKDHRADRLLPTSKCGRILIGLDYVVMYRLYVQRGVDFRISDWRVEHQLRRVSIGMGSPSRASPNRSPPFSDSPAIGEIVVRGVGDDGCSVG